MSTQAAVTPYVHISQAPHRTVYPFVSHFEGIRYYLENEDGLFIKVRLFVPDSRSTPLGKTYKSSESCCCFVDGFAVIAQSPSVVVGQRQQDGETVYKPLLWVEQYQTSTIPLKNGEQVNIRNRHKQLHQWDLRIGYDPFHLEPEKPITQFFQLH
jgi:hypothetical protein